MRTFTNDVRFYGIVRLITTSFSQTITGQKAQCKEPTQHRCGRLISVYCFIGSSKYEHIATLSNRNFSKFNEISANADCCTRSGSVTQYTSKSIQKRMSEDEVHDKLCQILNGDATTVARLNKASATVSSWSLNNRGKNWLQKYNCRVILMSSVTVFFH